MSKDKNWMNRVPLNIFMGASDNWTLPEFCQSIVTRLKSQTKIDITLYPEAYHDFDRPNSPLHEYNGLANVPYGKNHATVGTNENARQDAFKKVIQLLE